MIAYSHPENRDYYMEYIVEKFSLLHSDEFLNTFLKPLSLKKYDEIINSYDVREWKDILTFIVKNVKSKEDQDFYYQQLAERIAKNKDNDTILPLIYLFSEKVENFLEIIMKDIENASSPVKLVENFELLYLYSMKRHFNMNKERERYLYKLSNIMIDNGFIELAYELLLSLADNGRESTLIYINSFYQNFSDYLKGNYDKPLELRKVHFKFPQKKKQRTFKNPVDKKLGKNPFGGLGNKKAKAFPPNQKFNPLVRNDGVKKTGLVKPPKHNPLARKVNKFAPPKPKNILPPKPKIRHEKVDNNFRKPVEIKKPMPPKKTSLVQVKPPAPPKKPSFHQTAPVLVKSNIKPPKIRQNVMPPCRPKMKGIKPPVPIKKPPTEVRKHMRPPPMKKNQPPPFKNVPPKFKKPMPPAPMRKNSYDNIKVQEVQDFINKAPDFIEEISESADQCQEMNNSLKFLSSEINNRKIQSNFFNKIHLLIKQISENQCQQAKIEIGRISAPPGFEGVVYTLTVLIDALI